MITAEIIYQNEQAFVKLPENFLQAGKQWYALANAQTGTVSVVQGYPEWQPLLAALAELGEDDVFPDIERGSLADNRNLFADWEE